MTRYARAKGSKASNSRQVCSATPWHLLKNIKSVEGDVERVTKTGENVKADFKVGWYDFSTDSKCGIKDSGKISEKCNFRMKQKNKKKHLAIKLVKDLSPKSSGEVDAILEVGKQGKSKQLMECENKGHESRCSKLSTTKKSIQRNSTKSGHFRVTDNMFRSKDSIPEVCSTEKFPGDLRERRRKEKEIKREKKKVCFCCRRWGHQLAECPEAPADNKIDIAVTPGSFCYNCGSTEHKMTNCNKPGRKTLKYARCFVCNEEGHVARLCPDNPKGNYPKGGSCLLCGQINHLRADCPKANHEHEVAESSLTCVTSGPIESLPEDLRTFSAPVKSERVVQF